MDEYIWINELMAKEIHDRQIRKYGGSHGIRDEGLLISALANPKNVYAYDPTHTIASLASSYGYSIAKNHPFIDGNKRTAFLVVFIFLYLNGKLLEVPEPEAVIMMQNLASGTIDQNQFTQWIEKNL